MILESLVSTCDLSGNVNLAPMGPVVDPELTHFVLRPFRPSTTHDNLWATRRAVIHVTDDVSLYADAVMGVLDSSPLLVPDAARQFWVLDDCCRYFQVAVDQWIQDSLRPTAVCKVIDSGIRRPFFGFNRGKHAIIEAAILATRTHLIAPEEIRSQLQSLRSPVEKTASEPDQRTFSNLCRYIDQRLRTQAAESDSVD
jgi:hypothetical protein